MDCYILFLVSNFKPYQINSQASKFITTASNIHFLSTAPIHLQILRNANTASTSSFAAALLNLHVFVHIVLYIHTCLYSN